MIEYYVQEESHSRQQHVRSSRSLRVVRFGTLQSICNSTTSVLLCRLSRLVIYKDGGDPVTPRESALWTLTELLH